MHLIQRKQMNTADAYFGAHWILHYRYITLQFYITCVRANFLLSQKLEFSLLLSASVSETIWFIIYDLWCLCQSTYEYTGNLLLLEIMCLPCWESHQYLLMHIFNNYLLVSNGECLGGSLEESCFTRLTRNKGTTDTHDTFSIVIAALHLKTWITLKKYMPLESRNKHLMRLSHTLLLRCGIMLQDLDLMIKLPK